MSRVRRFKRTAKASTIVQAVPSRATYKALKGTAKWKERFVEARMLFLLDVAGFMVRAIQEKAPDIRIGGDDVDYSEGLRIGILEEGDDENVIAIYMDGQKTKVTHSYAAKTVLYFQPIGGSPDWVRVLSVHGPWPAEMVPVKVGKDDAKIISRRARSDEIAALSSRLRENAVDIERQLLAQGASNPSVGDSNNGIGLSAHEDLGYNVLRVELGFGDEKQVAHWRPAFVETKKYASRCMSKVSEYIVSGDKLLFDLPQETGNINKTVLKNGSGFSKEIAPFMK